MRKEVYVFGRGISTFYGLLDYILLHVVKRLCFGMVPCILLKSLVVLDRGEIPFWSYLHPKVERSGLCGKVKFNIIPNVIYSHDQNETVIASI